MAKVYINLKTDSHFWFPKPKYRGLFIDDIIRILRHVLKYYQHVGRPKAEFTRYEVQQIVEWILYKSKHNPFDAAMVSRTGKQRAFWHYFNTGFGIRNGKLFTRTGAMAARLAGYRHPKQRAWELINEYKRRRFFNPVEEWKKKQRTIDDKSNQTNRQSTEDFTVT